MDLNLGIGKIFVEFDSVESAKEARRVKLFKLLDFSI